MANPPDRVPLAHLPTPFEPMTRLGAALGGPPLFVKRDDCTGLALGGNKARKLEWLCAEALAAGCDVLVTGGGPQSNHVRMTSAAANRLGLDCHVALAGDPPAVPSGNLLVDQVLGARLHYTGPADYYELEAAIERLAGDLRRQGRHPFAIPVGGASVTGVLAYADAADELVGQGAAAGLVVVADGSGGTHAGLLAGFGTRVGVLGVDVGTRPDLDDVVPRLAAEAAARTARRSPRRGPTSTISASGPGTARSPTKRSRRSSSRRASRAWCSTPCTPARRWPASSPRSARSACPRTGRWCSGTPEARRRCSRGATRQASGRRRRHEAPSVEPAAAGPTSERDDQASRSLRATATPTMTRINSTSSFFTVPPGSATGTSEAIRRGLTRSAVAGQSQCRRLGLASPLARAVGPSVGGGVKLPSGCRRQAQTYAPGRNGPTTVRRS